MAEAAVMEGDGTGVEDGDVEAGYLDHGLKSVYYILEQFNKTWQNAWTAGGRLVIDESMLQWGGTGGAHLTWLPRKPTPLGIGMKTLVDHTSGILLHAELCEGKAIDR